MQGCYLLATVPSALLIIAGKRNGITSFWALTPVILPVYYSTFVISRQFFQLEVLDYVMSHPTNTFSAYLRRSYRRNAPEASLTIPNIEAKFQIAAKAATAKATTEKT
eukprot:Platyproteum_vivax@DN4081_c0_g2_i1.p1